MKVFKLSHGGDFFNDKTLKLLKQNNLVCVHPDTKAKGQSSKTQGQAFIDAKKGDVFYVCRSNNSIEFIGMFTDERPLYSIVEDQDDWINRSYKLLVDAKNPDSYDKKLDKWWTPRNRSTFAEVPKSDLELFEKKILKPVFVQSMATVEVRRNHHVERLKRNIDDYLELQEDFKSLMNNEILLFEKINSLSEIDLKKIQYSYLIKGDLSEQPVVLLRSKLLEKLLDGEQLDKDKLNELKDELAVNYDKNVYHAWKAHYRILYTFLYDEYKTDLELFFKNFIEKIQSDLKISKHTKFKLVHLDGPQNQGFDRIWFAIYNKTYRTQKVAKQLCLILNDKFEFGLLDQQNNDNTELKIADDFNYDSLLEMFSKHVNTILNDNSIERAKMEEFINILEYKKQIILQGPPGTGKTYMAKKIAKQIAGKNSVIYHGSLTPELIQDQFTIGQKIANASGKDDYYTVKEINDTDIVIQSHKSQPWKANYDRTIVKYEELANGIKPKNTNAFDPYELAVAKYLFRKIKPNNTSIVPNYTIVQFHPSYSYEDFVRGIAAKSNSGQLEYKTVNKVFAKICKHASDSDSPYVLIIDEINRANLPSVLGELIYALEYRCDSVDTMYALDGDSKISIPDNLYIIGTMNTADRSVAHIDYAIKRRFAFIDVPPNKDVIVYDKAKTLFDLVSELFKDDYLASDFDTKDVHLGHSYFLLNEESELSDSEQLKLKLDYEILPILNEYIKDGLLLETAKDKLKEISKFEC